MRRVWGIVGKVALFLSWSLGACGQPTEEVGEAGTAGRGGRGTSGASGAGASAAASGSAGIAGATHAGGAATGGGGQAGSQAGAANGGAAGAANGGAAVAANGGAAGAANGGAAGNGASAGNGGAANAGEGGTAGAGGTAPSLPEAICEPWPAPVDAHDQSVVPVEVLPQNPNVKKVVLIAGAKSDHPPGQHEFFAVTATLAKLFCQQPGIVPVVVRDGWPQNEAVLEGAATVVFYADGGDHHPLVDASHRAKIGALVGAGVGFVNLHYAVEYPTALQPEVLPWLGGAYEVGYSANPLWRANVGALPTHPITRGVDPFSIDDEWYFGLRWVSPDSAITPIVQATPPDDKRITPETAAHPGRLETMAWAYERPTGGRAFGFTGGHWYENWFDGPDTPDAAKQRRIVVNGILWTAGVEVPAAGANVDTAASDHGRWLDTK
jgi:hypothetical protein